MASKPSVGPRGGKTTVTKGGLIRVVIYLSPEERRALKQAALDREMPASEVVREAVRMFLSQVQDKAPI